MSMVVIECFSKSSTNPNIKIQEFGYDAISYGEDKGPTVPPKRLVDNE